MTAARGIDFSNTTNTFFSHTRTIHGLAQSPTFPYRDQISLSIIGPSLEPVNTGPIPGDPKPHNPRVLQTIVPTHTFDNPPEEGIDVLIVPGGAGARVLNVSSTVAFIADRYPSLQYLITVCTGAGVAARAGVQPALPYSSWRFHHWYGAVCG